MPLRDALIEAGRIRLRPIIMTTLALIAGMIPVALGRGEGADFRAPLGRAVIGGVITSTLLTLLVIPTVYEILSNTRSWLLSMFRSWFGQAARAGGRRPVPQPQVEARATPGAPGSPGRGQWSACASGPKTLNGSSPRPWRRWTCATWC